MTKAAGEIPMEKTPITVPPRMPTKSAMTVSSGTVATIAHIFWNSDKAKGFKGHGAKCVQLFGKLHRGNLCCYCRPEICPATIIAVIRGAQLGGDPNGQQIGHIDVCAKLAQLSNDCKAETAPIRNKMSPIIGRA